MTRVEIVATVLRLAAIWVFVAGIETLMITVLSAPVMGSSPFDIVLPLGILVTSVGTWVFAASLARKLLPEPDPGDVVFQWTKKEVQTVALGILGFYFLALGTSGLAEALLMGQWAGGAWPSDAERARNAAGLARGAVLFLFGVGLVLGKEKLQRAWGTIRGRDEGPLADEEDSSHP